MSLELRFVGYRAGDEILVGRLGLHRGEYTAKSLHELTFGKR